MKQINLLFCLVFFCIIAAAQKSGPVNTRKDQQKSGDFVIRILPARGGTYGYDIYKRGMPVIRQSRNPFTLSPVGLASKGDAYKLAKWQILQLEKNHGLFPARNNVSRLGSPAVAQKLRSSGNPEILTNQRLPVQIARDLQISISQ